MARLAVRVWQGSRDFSAARSPNGIPARCLASLVAHLTCRTFGMRGLIPGSLLAVLIAPTRLMAAQSDSTATILGLVADSAGTPLARVELAIESQSRVTFTTASGRFQFAGLAPGTYVVQLRRLGYRPGSWEVQLAAGERAAFQLRMESVAHELPTVTISGREVRLSRVYDRQRKGLGDVRFAEDLAKYQKMSLDDVLRFDPGFQAKLVAAPSCGSPAVFLDGRRIPPVSWSKSGYDGPLSDFVDLDEIDAIEVHKSADHLGEDFLSEDPTGFTAPSQKAGAIRFGRKLNPGAISFAGSCRRIVMIWTKYYRGK